MFRKHTIFLLVFAMMTTFLAPARLVLACQMQSQSTACPMMAVMYKAEGLSCCAKKATSPDAHNAEAKQSLNDWSPSVHWPKQEPEVMP